MQAGGTTYSRLLFSCERRTDVNTLDVQTIQQLVASMLWL